MLAVEELELVLSPGGSMRVRRETPEPQPAGSGWLDQVAGAFCRGRGPGLFALAARNPDGAALPPSFAFWRELGLGYMTALCRTAEWDHDEQDEIAPIPPPSEERIASIILGSPPMQGAEYLDPECYRSLWSDLDEWVRAEVHSMGKGLTGFLAGRAPTWHQVGRVTLHLAENRQDEAFPFGFIATYAPTLSRSGRVQHLPLSQALEEYAGAGNKRVLIQLLSPLQRAAKRSAVLADLVGTGDVFHPLAWNAAEAYRFLKDLAEFESSGLLVRVPDWWSKRPRPRVSLSIGEKKQNSLNMGAMLDFKVELALGDERLDEKGWKKLVAGQDGLVLLRGQWVEVDQEKLTEALDHWKEVEARAAKEGLSFSEGMRLLAGAPQDFGGNDEPEAHRDWSSVSAGPWLANVMAGLSDPSRLESARPGRALRAKLRPYQKTGIDWLFFLTRLGIGACLADDMGLGKTIQVLGLFVALRRERRETKPSLVLVPASLLANWKAEIEKFAPSLSACFLHSSEMGVEEMAQKAADPERAFSGKDLVVTTYGMVLRKDWLLSIDWRIVVLDEAQAIRNPGTGQARAVKKLKSEARLALTGTPVENRLSDLWSLFDFLRPGLLGSRKRFQEFVKSLEERDSDNYSPLRNLVRPYILRRLKTDRTVITDLPEKTEVKAFCGLAKKQAVLYQKSVNDLAKILSEVDGMKRRGLVLSFLVRFKQICNHPSQFLGDGLYDPAASGKFTRLRMICEEIASRQERALVFTQYREMTEPLAGFLAGVFGREGLILHGGTPVRRRRELIQDFERKDGPPFFVLSLKAGGTGLNLTSASHVIHFDRWWNPAVENQATDRAFRIGQKRNVLVHKFVCRGTIEERIDALIEEKQELARDVIEVGGERAMTEMSNDELIQFVTLDIERTVV